MHTYKHIEGPTCIQKAHEWHKCMSQTYLHTNVYAASTREYTAYVIHAYINTYINRCILTIWKQGACTKANMHAKACAYGYNVCYQGADWRVFAKSCTLHLIFHIFMCLRILQFCACVWCIHTCKEKAYMYYMHRTYLRTWCMRTYV